MISDVDDTIMITQAPTSGKAAYNLLLNPQKRASVPGMAVLFNRIADIFPDAPFFYLSTSPWNVESSIRHFIENYGFRPALCCCVGPRSQAEDLHSFGCAAQVEHAEQLMGDFPDMKFI